MIHTENTGILEAIKEIKQMSLSKGLRALYDAHMKEIRDRNARDDYVRDEGIAIGENRGIIIGQAQGEQQKLISLVRKKMAKNMPPEEIAHILEEDLPLIQKICNMIKSHPEWEDEKICQHL